MRAARHLVDDVGVPGILGFRSGQEVIDVAGGLLIPRGVVAVASMTSHPLITRLPQPPDQPRLVWRTTFNYDSLAQATASLLGYAIEPPDKSGRPTRLSLVRGDSVMSSTFADAFYKDAVLNGKPARDVGHDYQEIVLDRDAGVSTGEAVRLLAEAQPSIVVFLARDEESLAIVEALESRLPAGARRPAYVLALSDASVLAPFIGSSEERRRRAFGVTSSSSSTANARFVIRYNQARRVPVTRSTNPSSSYDAFYLLAYASFSLPPDERVTGVALATRFARLLGPGRSIEAGPTDIFAALDLLSIGKTIDLEGVASGLDFDPSTGEAPCDFSLDCPGVDEHGRLLNEDVESGVTYRARERRADGALRCP
jgi:branched-chain amino acid transport system substrate-binding protein